MAQFTVYDWKYGIKRRKLESVVQDLDRTARRKRERVTTLYLVNSIGANTTMTITDDSGNWSHTVVGGDGVAAINNAHPREDGGASWSNVVNDGTTANMAFEIDGLKAAYRIASLIVDPKGNLMNIDLDTLVVRKGSTAFFRAMEINGALKRDVAAGSAERDGAPFGAYNIVELPYIPSANAGYWWFMDSSMMGPELGLQIRSSQDVVMDAPFTDYKTKSIYVSSSVAFDFGHNDARILTGSDGTNS
jgi:hypothetical protein